LDEESRGILPKTKTTEAELICKGKPPINMEIIINYEYEKGKLKGFSGVARDITLRKQNEKELFFKANFDPLTKLNNRRSFMDIANREFDMAKRYSKPLSFIMFDIDFFKKVNDTYGHSVGDIVLKKVAEIGSKNLRATDVFGRLGGEEFAILATETDIEGAVLLAEKLRLAFERTVVTAENKKIRFTVSLGVTSINSRDKNIEELIDRADKYLYKAKELGRNKTIFY
jgi:diguanylate cyclase (GGDEF)-like protein